MLTIILPPIESDTWARELKLEHSLVSISKWESKHEKAFFGRPGEERTEEEMADYFVQMVVKGDPPEDFIHRLTKEQVQIVSDYINKKSSATWFNEDPNTKKSTEIITSELIYYWMISFNIPMECENWHLNRLMTLIKICGIKQSKPKKMSDAARMEQFKRLNAERKAKLGTSG